MNSSHIHDISFRRAALFAAVGLLGMALLAPVALYVGFENLVVPDDALLTMSNLRESQHLLRGFIAAFLVVAVLDVVVAWSLFIVFKPVARDLSLLAAWLRITYAAILALSLVPVLNVAQWIGGVGLTFRFSAEQDSVMISLQAFRNSWDIGLVVFGFHLVVLGYVAFRANFLPRYVGVLLGIAGIGYLIDSFGKLLSPNYDISIASFTFVGEVVLLVWLFIRAFRSTPE